MKKKYVVLLLLLLLLIIALLVYLAMRGNAEPQGIDGGTIGQEQESMDEVAGEEGTGTEAEPRIIEISVRNGEFSPSIIRAKKDEYVVLRISGTEGTHGFAVPYLGVNVAVSANQTVSIALPTDKAGEFAFICSIPCGPEHVDMQGMIYIEEE